MTVHKHLRVTRRFAASPERVFDAWLDPAVARKWLVTSPESEAHSVSMDVRVGGRWTFSDKRDGVEYTGGGEYLEIERPRRLVLTWRIRQVAPEGVRLTAEIAPTDTGCVLTVGYDHGLFASDDVLAESEVGWNQMFDLLSAALDETEEYAVVVAPNTLRFERLLPGPIERVWAYLVDSDKRAQWLGAGKIEPWVGSTVTLQVRHASLSPNLAPIPAKFKSFESGVSMDQRVLRYEPPRRLSLTWGDASAPSEVDFELTAEGDKVRLVLTHRRLTDHAAMALTACGWHAHLAVLIDRLNDRTPPSFWALFSKFEAGYRQRELS